MPRDPLRTQWLIRTRAVNPRLPLRPRAVMPLKFKDLYFADLREFVEDDVAVYPRFKAVDGLSLFPISELRVRGGEEVLLDFRVEEGDDEPAGEEEDEVPGDEVGGYEEDEAVEEEEVVDAGGDFLVAEVGGRADGGD